MNEQVITKTVKESCKRCKEKLIRIEFFHECDMIIVYSFNKTQIWCSRYDVKDNDIKLQEVALAKFDLFK